MIIYALWLEGALVYACHLFIFINGKEVALLNILVKFVTCISLQENWLLLTADYSQIELRLMAHFSRDSSLTELLSKPHGDVFTMIAAKWTGKPESVVGYQEREQTKRLVYGILYGMGANTLAKQLECSLGEAEEKIRSFRSSFPGVASWLHEAVACCCKKGWGSVIISFSLSCYSPIIIPVSINIKIMLKF